MAPFVGERFGNPSGVHATAQQAKNAIEAAREQIAASIGARDRVALGDHTNRYMRHLAANDHRPVLFDDGVGNDDALDGINDGARLIEISASGASWAPRWSRLVEACEEFRC